MASATRPTVLLQETSRRLADDLEAGDPEGHIQHRVIHTDAVDGRERYQLLTSLVVPRPIGWVSTRAASGVPNVAPFSFCSAVASSPMLVSLSIGTRAGVAKDSLRNILDQGAFDGSECLVRKWLAEVDTADLGAQIDADAGHRYAGAFHGDRLPREEFDLFVHTAVLTARTDSRPVATIRGSPCGCLPTL